MYARTLRARRFDGLTGWRGILLRLDWQVKRQHVITHIPTKENTPHASGVLAMGFDPMP